MDNSLVILAHFYIRNSELAYFFLRVFFLSSFNSIATSSYISGWQEGFNVRSQQLLAESEFYQGQKFPVYSTDSNPELPVYGAEMTLTMVRLKEGRGKQTQRRRERDIKTNAFSIVISESRKKSRDVTSN